MDYVFDFPGIYGILGHNGSGKSTLLRIIAGMQSPTVGKCHFRFNGVEIPNEKTYQYISYCAPGMDIIEEMTLKEFLQFHFSFKQPYLSVSIEKIIDILNFKSVQNKMINEFSSGMKQRVKLAQAIFSDTPVLILDEPISNLDDQGVLLYENLLQEYGNNRLVLIASNDEKEYRLSKQTLQIEDFPPVL